MTHIESRPSKSKPGAEYDFYVECVCTDEQKEKLVKRLEDYSTNVNILSRDPNKDEGMGLSNVSSRDSSYGFFH